MFDELSIHKAVTPTVFLELLIGLSPIALTPPETMFQARILHPGFHGGDRDASTEDIYGYGLGVDHA